MKTRTRQRLERLRQEFKETTGKNVSMSNLIESILESYLDRLPSKEIEEEKTI